MQIQPTQKNARLICGVRQKDKMIRQFVIRLFAYVSLIATGSLLLQTFAQVIGQILIIPVIFPLFLLSLLFNRVGAAATWLDVDSGPFAAFLLRGLVTGIFWGGCIAFPFDMYRRTKQRKYKLCTILFSI